jgi:uncharacterized protein involved in exopolysaccharide biosynthesis
MEHGSNGVAHDGAVPERREISLVEVANTILRNWRLVVAIPLGLAFVTGLWSLSGERSAKAFASFLPQSEGRSGAAAALAQQFGLSLGFDQPGTSPQFYVDLLKSQGLLRKVVESEFDVTDEDGTERRATLIDIYEIEEGGRLPEWRVAVQRLEGAIAAGYTYETGVVEFAVTARTGRLAEQLATRLLEILNEFNQDVRQRVASEEARFIAGRVTAVQEELLAAEGELEQFLVQNREFRNSPELSFEHDRLQRKMAVRQEVYTSLLRSQEQVRIDGVRDTPLFTIIDHPAGSATPQGRGTVRRVILALILGTLLSLFVIFGRELLLRGGESEDDEYREFRGLIRQTWGDLRQPRRWIPLRGNGAAVAAGKSADDGAGSGRG